MPIYEYECPKCGVIEVMQGIKDKPLKKCPTCSSKVQKLISMSSFHLKGTGWYVTDYGRGNGGNGNGKSEQKEKEGTSEVKDKKSEAVESSAASAKGKDSASSKNASTGNKH